MKTYSILIVFSILLAMSIETSEAKNVKFHNHVRHHHVKIHGDSHFDWARFFRALRKRETGGKVNGGVGCVGDNGHALGPYQIWRKYWHDAIEYRPSIGGRYEDVNNPRYAEKIIRAYLDRYAKVKTYERCARIHNGGPGGDHRKATLGYWILFKKYLKED